MTHKLTKARSLISLILTLALIILMLPSVAANADSASGKLVRVGYYEMIRMAGERHPEDRDDHKVHTVGLGLTVIDEEMRETLDRSQTLAVALDAAVQANKAKTAFLSSMSHEIRTPMNAIIGLNSLALRDETLSDDTREYLEKIGGSALPCMRIIPH